MHLAAKPRVCILDYGSGNVRSVFNLFDSLCQSVVISNDPVHIQQATHLVLPGVGAFGTSMERIRSHLPLEEVFRAVQETKKPFLGICVGMQCLATKGFEFGEHEGLGWISGKVDALSAGNLPVPHVGWNNVELTSENPLFPDPRHLDFYFVHSYVLRPDQTADVVARTQYGEHFCAVIQKENIIGVQFHPEKSQKAGRRFAIAFLSFQ